MTYHSQPMPVMRITALQTDIVWENKSENLRRLREQLTPLSGTTEIVVLPETFHTGFTPNLAAMAEAPEGETWQQLKHLAAEFKVALAGSMLVATDTSSATPRYTNRAFFITPEGNCHHYDKRHLFRMSHEAELLTPGTDRQPLHYRGWNILLQVCYDLRFPVWSRNYHNAYDLLINVANWPASRRKAWDVLLQARAIENCCYVCGVNRIGIDNAGCKHNGGSIILSPRGETLATVPDSCNGAATAELSLPDLQAFRHKFPAWKDGDAFSIYTL